MIPAIATEEAQRRAIRPESIPQEQFLSTPADFALYGGAKGGGKSYALLMEPLRHIHNGHFGATIFRLTYPQIMTQGGLWETANEIYPRVRLNDRPPIPKEGSLEWVFPSGAKIKFAHMQYDKDRFNFDGAQIPLIGFDQLEQFSWKQFSYMFSVNRSTCGVIPYIRATCNPDPDHWLRRFLEWWIDDETGLAIKERSGIVRWFTMLNDEVEWGDSRKELIDRFGEKTLPLSFTFIPASVYDNRILLEKNPEYLASLQNLPLVDRERLLEGNWNVRESAGMFFKREWFEIVDTTPPLEMGVRYWDEAATPAKPGKAPTGSWTAGVLMGKDEKGVFYIVDVIRFQGTSMKVEQTEDNVASQDGYKVRPVVEQDPAQAGKAKAEGFVRRLAGYNAALNPVRESKGTRAKPLSAQAEVGNVKLVRGPWNEAFLRELENFDGTDKCVSDQVDGASGAFHMLTVVKRAGTWGRG